MYSYTGEDSGKRAKGVKKSVLRKTISHDDYKTCLLDKKVHSRDMPGLRSYHHTIHGETVHKVALAPLHTKRYILPDGIITLAFGHVDIPTSASNTTEPHTPAPDTMEVEAPTDTQAQTDFAPCSPQHLISHSNHSFKYLLRVSNLYIAVIHFQSINQSMCADGW